MTREEHEEKYIHFVSCIENLNDAWRILKQVKRRKNNSLAYTAFKFALIEYSKPYKTSYGKINAKHVGLGSRFIPAEYSLLHQRILDARDTFLAHSDLTIKDAQLYVTEHSSRKSVVVGQNVINAATEFSKIDEILDLIEKTLLSMYEEEKVLEGDLVPNFSPR